ncbi:MAG: Ca-activated chloride channel [Acidobacteriota bacterium]|jgi:Ca-activated chloride channel family protein|nr:Ca-activated chloride channel [Acidobacteriota bacterium]
MRSCFVLALSMALAFLFFSASTTRAQTFPQEPPPVMPTPKPKPPPPPKDEDYEVVRVTSNLVVVPVSVTDASGQSVFGLKVSDFHLDEEGRAQQVSAIGDPEQTPLDIAILLDVSGSVDARFGFEKTAAARFLKQVLKADDRAAVFAIDQTPRLEQVRDTAERAAVRLLSMQSAKGATAFYDSVIAASRYLAQNTPPQHRRVIVVISDGEDNFSNRTREIELATYRAMKSDDGPLTKQRRDQLVRLRDDVQRQVVLDVQRELQHAEVVFYSINPSGEALRLNIPGVRAQEGMARLAQTTGGNAFVPDKLENLESVFRQITAELRSQYLIQYYSNNESTPNKFLRIKVSVPAQPAFRIRAREGYYPKNVNRK